MKTALALALMLFIAVPAPADARCFFIFCSWSHHYHHVAHRSRHEAPPRSVPECQTIAKAFRVLTLHDLASFVGANQELVDKCRGSQL